jgi:hypothetical protein
MDKSKVILTSGPLHKAVMRFMLAKWLNLRCGAQKSIDSMNLVVAVFS